MVSDMTACDAAAIGTPDEFAVWRKSMAADMAARPREMLVGAKAHWLRLGAPFGEDAAAAVQEAFEAKQK